MYLQKILSQKNFKKHLFLWYLESPLTKRAESGSLIQCTDPRLRIRYKLKYVDEGKFLPIQAEYKLKKERWKRDMDSQDTPKSQRNQGDNSFFFSVYFKRGNESGSAWIHIIFRSLIRIHIRVKSWIWIRIRTVPIPTSIS
jgi:hypothetical protein